MMGDKTRDSSQNLDSLIKSVLCESHKPLSTYEIAKKAGVSWSTANMHCFKLKAQGVLSNAQTASSGVKRNGAVFRNNSEARAGRRKKVIWWVSE